MRPPPPALPALLAATLGGCVIPVSPEFEDAEPNYPPYVVTSDPGEGDVFTVTAQDRSIAITLSDQNVNDILFIRFLVDYPSNDMSISHKIFEPNIPTSGMPVRQTLRIQPSCSVLQLSPGHHRLLMSVADRKFLDELAGDSVATEAPLDSVPQGANRVRVFWILNCP